MDGWVDGWICGEKDPWSWVYGLEMGGILTAADYIVMDKCPIKWINVYLGWVD